MSDILMENCALQNFLTVSGGSVLYYISGGQRSGKSSYAQKLALELSPRPYYLATARMWDDDFKKRIERHQKDRDERWGNVEIEKTISSFSVPDDINSDPDINIDSDINIDPNINTKTVVVLDCITLWLTNFFTDNNGDIEKTLAEVKAEWDRFAALPLTIIAISNEIGMGLHPQSETGLKFTDLQGFVNQYVAGMADRQIFMVSGNPIHIHGE
ncbi:MAG: bifunctional adenosylcobinamide kinase/adenosylcobinamide-phosphate guanylyltransferase [Salinispira sp.]